MRDRAADLLASRKQLFQDKLHGLIGRKNDEIPSGLCRVHPLAYPRMPDAARVPRLTSPRHSLRAGCWLPRVIVVPSRVLEKHKSCSGQAILRRTGEWLATSICALG